MIAAFLLAAARNNPVGPYVTPRPEWLEGWCGPVEYLDHEAAENGDTEEPAWRPAIVNALGMVWYEDEDCGWRPVDRDDPGLRLDLRRPECRDLLVRHGCPAWARDVPAAVWAWGMTGKAPRMMLRAWDSAWAPRMDRWSLTPVNGVCASTMIPDKSLELEDWVGWMHRFPADSPSSGPETGDLGRACADLAALRAGCVLEEAGGWYVPLVGGGVGWWQREVSGG